MQEMRASAITLQLPHTPQASECQLQEDGDQVRAVQDHDEGCGEELATEATGAARVHEESGVPTGAGQARDLRRRDQHQPVGQEAHPQDLAAGGRTHKACGKYEETK